MSYNEEEESEYHRNELAEKETQLMQKTERVAACWDELKTATKGTEEYAFLQDVHLDTKLEQRKLKQTIEKLKFILSDVGEIETSPTTLKAPPRSASPPREKSARSQLETTKTDQLNTAFPGLTDVTTTTPIRSVRTPNQLQESEVFLDASEITTPASKYRSRALLTPGKLIPIMQGDRTNAEFFLSESTTMGQDKTIPVVQVPHYHYKANLQGLERLPKFSLSTDSKKDRLFASPTVFLREINDAFNLMGIGEGVRAQVLWHTLPNSIRANYADFVRRIFKSYLDTKDEMNERQRDYGYAIPTPQQYAEKYWLRVQEAFLAFYQPDGESAQLATADFLNLMNRPESEPHANCLEFISLLEEKGDRAGIRLDGKNEQYEMIFLHCALSHYPRAQDYVTQVLDRSADPQDFTLGGMMSIARKHAQTQQLRVNLSKRFQRPEASKVIDQAKEDIADTTRKTENNYQAKRNFVFEGKEFHYRRYCDDSTLPYFCQYKQCSVPGWNSSHNSKDCPRKETVESFSKCPVCQLGYAKGHPCSKIAFKKMAARASTVTFNQQPDEEQRTGAAITAKTSAFMQTFGLSDSTYAEEPNVNCGSFGSFSPLIYAEVLKKDLRDLDRHDSHLEESNVKLGSGSLSDESRE
jgi:hypothetical protein